MSDSTLRDFVKEALEKGESRENIAAALRGAGWAADQIEGALGAYADVAFAVPVPRPRQQGSAREAFLYVVYFFLVGLIAIYVGALSFAWIDSAFSDALFDDSQLYRVSGLRWGVASLLVGYPIFIVLGWRLGVRRREDPQRRASRVRVWLTYIALIFAATTFIGDLVFVVFRFLSGELGGRFMSKAAVVAVIAGVILLNYTRDAERESGKRDAIGWATAGVVTAVVIALLIWAFTVVMSPYAARAQKADAQRLNDLGVLVRLVDCHRSAYGEIPADLQTLAAKQSERLASGLEFARGCGAEPPRDPHTGADYAYRRLEGDRFELCATMEFGWPQGARGAAADRRRPIGVYGSGREDRYILAPEKAGEACFEFEAVDFSQN